MNVPASNPEPATDARLRDNRDQLVEVVVAARIAHPRLSSHVPRLDDAGRLVALPGHGGVAPGIELGTPVFSHLGDHLMVGASLEAPEVGPETPGALHYLACIGNPVMNQGGEPIGVVVGKRGGIAPGYFAPNLVSAAISTKHLANLVPGDRLMVAARGRGLDLIDWPKIGLRNLSPELLDDLPITPHAGRLEVAVRAIVPGHLAGPGLGQDVWIGDLEIAGSIEDPAVVDLRYGDLVAFEGIDGRVSRHHAADCVAIGVVAHGPSPAPGHGVGITILLSGPVNQLGAHVDDAGTLVPRLAAMARGANAR